MPARSGHSRSLAIGLRHGLYRRQMKPTAFSLPFGRGCGGAAMSRRDFPVTALGTDSAPIAAGRQQYLKDRTMGPAEGHRQTTAMIFYDRPADRQTHAHAMRLCRKERLKEAVDVFGIDAHSGVFHHNQQTIESIYSVFTRRIRARLSTALIASTAFLVKFTMTCCN